MALASLGILAAGALEACDVLLGLNRYESCAVNCDAATSDALVSERDAAADSLSAAEESSATDAADESAAEATESAAHAFDSSVPGPHPIWAEWPMPNPDASIAPDSSIPLPNPMLYDAGGDGSIFDTVTGLVWQTDGSGSAKDYPAASSLCQALGREWRVPARIEIVSLIDFSRTGLHIDEATFTGTQRGPYWTSSSLPHDAGSPIQWWTVSFETGMVDDSIAPQWVRCVSVGRANLPPAQYGLFDRSNQTIHDNGTHLTWQRYPPAQTMSFAAASDSCAILSLQGLSSGWRVPSYKELLTLVDESPHLEYEASGLVQKAIDSNAFLGTATDAYYWTSSSYASDATYAYSVNFRDGLAFKSQVATDALHVRCVHD